MIPVSVPARAHFQFAKANKNVTTQILPEKNKNNNIPIQRLFR
jgi:hypothetical protein